MKRIEQTHKKILVIGIVCLCNCMIVGCKSNPVFTNQPVDYHPPQNISTIVPLATGNVYVYDKISCSFDSTCLTNPYIFRKVGDQITIRNQSAFWLSGSIDGLSIIRADSASLEWYSQPWKGSPMMPRKLLATPVRIGTTWKISDWDSVGTYSGLLTITEVNATIEVGGKKYSHAIVVESTGTSPVYLKYCFVPGIGIVYESKEYPLYSGWAKSVKLEMKYCRL